MLRMDNTDDRDPSYAATILLVDDTPAKLLAYEVMLAQSGRAAGQGRFS